VVKKYTPTGRKRTLAGISWGTALKIMPKKNKKIKRAKANKSTRKKRQVDDWAKRDAAFNLFARLFPASKQNPNHTRDDTEKDGERLQ